MDKVEKILERYKVYLGVKDVKLVVRPYKARTAFSDLTNRVIYLNKYLIDDEEVVEYLILRELIHKAQHVPFEVRRRLVLRGEVRQHSTLLYQRRRLKRLGKDGKAERGEQKTRSMTSLFPSLCWSPRAASCSAAGAESFSGGMPSLCRGRKKRKKGLFVLFLFILFIRIAY